MRKLPELVRKNQRKTSNFDGFTLYELKPVAEPETEIRGPEPLRQQTLTVHYRGSRIELPSGFSSRDLVRVIRVLGDTLHD
jgi:hypothetical protein